MAIKTVKLTISYAILFGLLLTGACIPGPSDNDPNTETITLYGFSIMKEVLENDIFPAFAAKWKQEHGKDVNFISSFGGSESMTNQILWGAPADVAILSIDRDAQRLFDGKVSTTDWHQYPNKGIINSTPFVILVRKGNPKGIHDFPDLTQPGVQVINADPVSSGGGQWSVLAVYGSELKKSETETGTQDPERAMTTLKAIWNNVRAAPGSAREARTVFENGYGDALITYELDGLLMNPDKTPFELIIPKATIFSEHPVVAVDRNITAANRPVVEAFIQYLWTDEAQEAFVKYHFRSVTSEALNDANKEFAKIEEPFSVEMFGGWSRAYPDIIENVYRHQIEGKHK